MKPRAPSPPGTRTGKLRRLPARAGLLVGLLAASACSGTSSTSDLGTHPGAPATASPPAARAGGGPHLAYVALGASETYGVGANPVTNGYAYRLRDQLGLGISGFADVAIPGATLADAYQPELTNALSVEPTVCTVFFGVNDIRAGVPLTQFASDLTDLVTTLRRARAHVLIVGIPELGDLPALHSFPAAQLAAATQQWNAAVQGVATATQSAFLGLTDYSHELATHPEEIAADGLHPSNLGHARLAQVILATLRSQGYI